MPERLITFEIEDVTYGVPDPLIITEDALSRNAVREKATGIISVYDYEKFVGGIIEPGNDAIWILFRPIMVADFASEVNRIIGNRLPRLVS